MAARQMERQMLTKTETEALEGIVGSDFHDGNHPVGNWVWSWSCNPFQSKRQFSGAVSSLVKKGFVKANGAGEDACLSITQSGFDALRSS
jgi:hypothetical protein